MNKQKDLLNKLDSFIEHLKKVRQQFVMEEVTKENYVSINQPAFMIDQAFWEYLKLPKKK